MFYHVQQLTSNCDKLNPVKKMAMFNGRITKAKKFTKYDCMQSHFEYDFNAETAKRISQEFIRKIKARRKVFREMPAFADTVRNEVLYLHDYNLTVFKTTQSYPLSEEYSQLLLQYVLLECKILYKREYYSKSTETKTQNRVLRLLLNIYNDYFESKLMRRKDITDRSIKAIIEIFVKIKTQFNLNYIILENMAVALLKKNGQFEKINALRGKQLPLPLEGCLSIDPSLSSFYRTVTTSDYGTDDGSSNGPRIFHVDGDDDDDCDKTENSPQISENISDDEIKYVDFLENREAVNSANKTGKTKRVYTICLDESGLESDEEVVFLDKEIETKTKEKTNHRGFRSDKGVAIKKRISNQNQHISKNCQPESTLKVDSGSDLTITKNKTDSSLNIEEDDILKQIDAILLSEYDAETDQKAILQKSVTDDIVDISDDDDSLDASYSKNCESEDAKSAETSVPDASNQNKNILLKLNDSDDVVLLDEEEIADKDCKIAKKVQTVTQKDPISVNVADSSVTILDSDSPELPIEASIKSDDANSPSTTIDAFLADSTDVSSSGLPSSSTSDCHPLSKNISSNISYKKETVCDVTTSDNTIDEIESTNQFKEGCANNFVKKEVSAVVRDVKKEVFVAKDIRINLYKYPVPQAKKGLPKKEQVVTHEEAIANDRITHDNFTPKFKEIVAPIKNDEETVEASNEDPAKSSDTIKSYVSDEEVARAELIHQDERGILEEDKKETSQYMTAEVTTTKHQGKADSSVNKSEDTSQFDELIATDQEKTETVENCNIHKETNLVTTSENFKEHSETETGKQHVPDESSEKADIPDTLNCSRPTCEIVVNEENSCSAIKEQNCEHSCDSKTENVTAISKEVIIDGKEMNSHCSVKQDIVSKNEEQIHETDDATTKEPEKVSEDSTVKSHKFKDTHLDDTTNTPLDIQENIPQPSDEVIPEFSKRDSLVSSSKTVEETQIVPVKRACKYSLRSHKESEDSPLDTDSIQEGAQNETTVDSKDTSPTHCKTTDDIHLANANSVSDISEQKPASPVRQCEKRYSLRSYCDFEEKYLAALQSSKEIVDHTETADPETFEKTHLVVAGEPLAELEKEVEVKRVKPERKYSLRSHRESEDINFSDTEEQFIHQANQDDEVVLEADAVREVNEAKSVVGDHEEKISEDLGIEGKEEHQKVSNEKEEEIEKVTESIRGEKEERNKKNMQADNSVRQAEDIKNNEDKNSDKTHLVESIVKEQIEEVREIGCDESVVVDEKNNESSQQVNTENKIEPQTIPDLNQSEKELQEIKNHEDKNTEDICSVDTEHQLKDVEKTRVIEKVDDTRSKVENKNLEDSKILSDIQSETQIKPHLSEDEKKAANVENIQENKLLTDANTLSDITEGKPTNSFLQDEKIVHKIDTIEEANRNVITDQEKTINEHANLADTGPQMQVTHDVTQSTDKIPEIEGVEEIVTETVIVEEMSNENIEETPQSVDNSVEVSHEYSICKSPFINEVIVETPLDKEDVSLDIDKVIVQLQEDPKDHEERYTDSNVDIRSQNEEILLTELHPSKTDAVTADLNKIEEIHIPEDKIKNLDQTGRFEKCNQEYIERVSEDLTPPVLEETKTNMSDSGIINTLLHNKDLVLNNCAIPQVQTVKFLHDTIKTSNDVVESQFSKNNSLVDYFINKTKCQEALQKQESPVPNKLEVLFQQGAGYCDSIDPDISDWNIYKEEVVQAEVSAEPCVDLHLLASAAVEIIKQKSETPTLDMFKGRRRRSKAKNRAKCELLKRDPKKLKTDRSVKRKLRIKLDFDEGAELIEDGKRVTRSAYRKNIFECVLKPQEFKTILPINNVKIHQLPDSVAVKDSTDSDSNDSECNKLFIDDKKDDESETLIYNEDTAEESFLFCYEPRVQCLEEENTKDEEPKIYLKTKTKAEYKSYDSNLNPYVKITRLEKNSDENQNKGSDLPLYASAESNVKKSEPVGENNEHCDVMKPNENTETVTEAEENKNKPENDYSLITNKEPLNFSTSTPPKLRYKLACRNTVKFTAEKLEKRLKTEVEKPFVNTPEVTKNETKCVDVDPTNKPDENNQVDMVILERQSFDSVEDVPLNLRLKQSKEDQDQHLNLQKEPSPISSKSSEPAPSEDIFNELDDVPAISSNSAMSEIEITETAVKEDIDTSNNSKATDRKTSEKIKDDIDITSISRQLKKKISIATTGQRKTSDITKKSQKSVKIKTTAVKESVDTSNISKESQKKIIENIEDCNISTKSENRTLEASCSKEQIDKSNSSKTSEKETPDAIDDVAKHTDTSSSKKDGKVLEKIETSSAKKHKIETAITIDASNISKKSKSKIYEKVQAAVMKGHIDASNRSKKLEKKTREHIRASNIARKSQKNIPEQDKTFAVAELIDPSKSKKISVIEEPIVSTTHIDTSKKSKKKTTEIIETTVANTDSANISKKSEKNISGVTAVRGISYTSKKLCKEIPDNTVAGEEHAETSNISMKKIPDTIETAVDTSGSTKSQQEIPKTIKTTVGKEPIEASSGLKKPEREVPGKTKVIDNSKRSKRLDKIVKEKIGRPAVDEKIVTSNNSKETVTKEQVDKSNDSEKQEAIVVKEHVTKSNTSKNQEGDISDDIANTVNEKCTEMPKMPKELKKLIKEKIEIPVLEENIESSTNSKETDTGNVETVVNKEHVNKSSISKKQERDIIENMENTVTEKCCETNKKSKRLEKIIKENIDIPAVEGKLESSTNSKKTGREIPVKIEAAIKEHVDKYNAAKVPEESITEKIDSTVIEKCTETLRKSNRLEKIIKEKMKITAVKEEIDASNTAGKPEKAIIEKCIETPKRSNRQTASENETPTKVHANQFNSSKKHDTDITENIANTVIAKSTETPKKSKKLKNITKEIKRSVPGEEIESSTTSKETTDKQIPRKIETIASNENVDKSNTSKSLERDVVENMVIDKYTETNKKSKKPEKILKKSMEKSAVKVEIDPSNNSEGTDRDVTVKIEAVTDERVDKSNTSKKQERNLTENIEHTIINKCSETPKRSSRLEKTKEKIENTGVKEEIVVASNNSTGTDRALLGKIKTVDTQHVDEPSISKKPERTITEQIENTVTEKYTETPKRSNRLEKIVKEKTDSPAGEEKIELSTNLKETDTEISQQNETVIKEHADKSNTSNVPKTENAVTEKCTVPPKKLKKLENIIKERIKSPAREEKIESSTYSKETDRDIPENMETVVNKEQVDKSKTSRKSRKNIPKKIDTTAVKEYTDSFIISKKEISKNITPTANIEDLGKSTDPSNISKKTEEETPAVVKSTEVSASIQSEKRLPENIISAEILFDNAVDLQLYTGNVTSNCENATAKVTVEIPESKKIKVLSNVMISPKKAKSDVYYSCLQGTETEIENKPDVGCKNDTLILNSSIEISVKDEPEIKDTSPIENEIKDTQKGVKEAISLKPEENEVAKKDPIQSKSEIKEGQKGKSPIKDTNQTKEVREAISPTRKSFMFDQKEIDQLIEKYSECDKGSCRKSNRRRKSNVEKRLEKKVKVNDEHEGRKSTFVSSSIENEEINTASSPDKIELRSSRKLRSKSYTAETRSPAESTTEKKLRSKSVSIAECKKLLETSAEIKDFPKIVTNVERVTRRGNKRRRSSSSRSMSSDKQKQDTTSSNKIIEETPLKNSWVSKLREEVNTTQSKRILRKSTTKIEKEEGQTTSKLQKRSKKSAVKMKCKTSAKRDSQLTTSDNIGSEIKISEEKCSTSVLDGHEITQEIPTNTEKNKNEYENVSVQIEVVGTETIVKDSKQLKNVANEDKGDVELTAVDDGSAQKSPDLEQITSHVDQVSEVIDKDKIDLNSATEKNLSTANTSLNIENISSEEKREVQVEFYSESLEDLKEEIKGGTVTKPIESKDASSALEDYLDNSVIEKVPELDTNCFVQPSEEISVTSQPLQDNNEVVEKEEPKIENTSEDVSKKSSVPQTCTKFRDLVIKLENRPAVEFYGSFIASRVPPELSEPINLSKNKDIPKGTKRRNQCLRKESKNRGGPQFDESYQKLSKIKRISGRDKNNIKDTGKDSEKTKIVKSKSRKDVSLVKLGHTETKSDPAETRLSRRKSKASLESSSNKTDTVLAKEEEIDVCYPLADPNLAQTLPEESKNVKEDSSKVLPVDVETAELHLLTNKQVMETSELKMEKAKIKEPESKKVLCEESKTILADAEIVKGSDLTTIDQSSEVREQEVKCSFANQDSALIIPEEVKKDENVSTTEILNLPKDQEIVSELTEDILTTKVDNTEIFPSNYEDSSKECGDASTEKESIANNQESEVPEQESSRMELIEESFQDQNSIPKIPEDVKNYNSEELVSSDILHLSKDKDTASQMKEEIISSTKIDNVDNSATNHKYICENASILKEFVINDPPNEVSEKDVTPGQPNDVYKKCYLSEDNRSLENPEAITEEDEKVEEYNSSEVINCAINTSNMSNNNEFASAKFEEELTLQTVGLKATLAVNDPDIVSKDSTKDLAVEEVVDQPIEVSKEDVAVESQPNVDKFETLPQVNENVQEYTSTENITSIKGNVAHTEGKDLIGQQTFVIVAVPNISTVNSSGTSKLLCGNVVVAEEKINQNKIRNCAEIEDLNAQFDETQVKLPGFEQSSQVPVTQPDNKNCSNSLATPDLENVLNNVPFFNNQSLLPNIPNTRDISSSEFNISNIEMPKIPSRHPIIQQTEVGTSEQADLVVNEQINKENGVVAAYSTKLDKFGSELHQNLQNSEILNSAEKLETTTNAEFKNSYADINAQRNEKTELPHTINDHFKFPTVAALPSRKRKMPPPEDHATLPKRCRTRIVTDIYDSEPSTSTGIYARKKEQRYIESVFNRLKDNTTWDIPDAPYEEEVVATEDAYIPTLEEISNSLMATNENQNQSLLPATEQALVYRDLDTDISPSDFDFFTKLFVTKTTSYVVEQRAFPIKKPKHIPSWNTSQSFGITSEQTVSSNFGPKYRDVRSQKISIVKSRTISLTENNVYARPENMQNGESRITSKKEITMYNINNHGAFSENNSSLDSYFPPQGNRHGSSNSQMRAGGENVPYPCSEIVPNGADTRITSKNEITLFNLFNNHYNQGDANYNEISADNYGGGSEARAITDADNVSSGDTRIRSKNEIALFNLNNNNYNQANSDLEIYFPQGNQHGGNNNSQLKAITDGTNDHNYSYYTGDPVMSMADDGNDMLPNASEFENVILNFGDENEFLDSTSSLLDLDLPDENASRRESEPYPAWDNESKVIVLPNEQYINHNDTPVVIAEDIVDNSVPEPWVQEESVTDEVHNFRNSDIVLFNQQDNSLNQQGDFNPSNVLNEDITTTQTCQTETLSCPSNVLTEEIASTCQPETLQTSFNPSKVSNATNFETDTLQNSFNSNSVLTEQIPPATCQTETLENNMHLPDENLELYKSLSLTDDAVTEEPGSLGPTNNAENEHTGISQCISGNTFTDKPETGNPSSAFTEKPKTESSDAPLVPEQPVHAEKSDRPKDEDSPHKNTGKSKRVEQQLALYKQLQAKKKLKQEGQNDEKQKSGGIPSRQYLTTRPGEWTKLSGSPPMRNSPTKKQQAPVEVEKPNRSSDKTESLDMPNTINTDDATIKATPIPVPMTNGFDKPIVEPLTVEPEKVVEQPIKIPTVKDQDVLKDVSIIDERRQENNLEQNRHDTKKPTTGHRNVVVDEATKLSKQPPKPHFSPTDSNSVENARTMPLILSRRGSEVSLRTEDPSKHGYLSKKSPLPSPSRESKPSSKELKRPMEHSTTPPTRTSEKPAPIIKRNPHECRAEPGSSNMMPSRNRGSSEIPQDRVPGSRSERRPGPGGSSKMSRDRVPGYSSEMPHTRVSGNGSEVPRARVAETSSEVPRTRVPVNTSEMPRTRVLINPSEMYDRVPRGSSEIHDRVPGGGIVPGMDMPRDKVPERDANTQPRGRVPEFYQIPTYENLEVSSNIYDTVKSRKRAATKRDSSVESNVPPSRSHHDYRTRRKSKKSPDAAAAASETFYNQLPERSKTPRNVQQDDDRAPSNSPNDLKMTIRKDNSNAQYTTYSSSPGSYSKPNNYTGKYTIDDILNKSKGPPTDGRKSRAGNYERGSSGTESSNKPKVVKKSHDAFDDLLKKGAVNPYFHSNSNSKNQRPEDSAQSAYKRPSERSSLESGYSNKRRLDGQAGPWKYEKIRRDSSQGYGGSSSRSNPEFDRARQEQRPSSEYKYPSSSYRDIRDGSGYYSRKPNTSSSSNPSPHSYSSSGYYEVLSSYRRKEEHLQHPKKDTQPYTGKGIVLSEEKKNELLEDLKNMVQVQLNKSNKSAKNNSEADWYQGLAPLLSDNPHGLSQKE